MAGVPDRQIVCKANRKQNHTESGIVSPGGGGGGT